MLFRSLVPNNNIYGTELAINESYFSFSELEMVLGSKVDTASRQLVINIGMGARSRPEYNLGTYWDVACSLNYRPSCL